MNDFLKLGFKHTKDYFYYKIDNYYLVVFESNLEIAVLTNKDCPKFAEIPFGGMLGLKNLINALNGKYYRNKESNFDEELESLIKPFSEKLKKAVIEWVEYKRKIKEPYKTFNFITILKKYIDETSEFFVINELIFCMANEYKGFYHEGRKMLFVAPKIEPKKTIDDKITVNGKTYYK